MTLATFALLLGLLMYLIGLPLLLNEKDAVSWWKKFFKGSEVLVSLLGGALTLLSAVTLRYNWRLTPDADGFVVLLAWVTFFKGLWITWQPREYSKIALHALTKHQLELLYGFLAIVWGAFFTYLGFVLA